MDIRVVLIHHQILRNTANIFYQQFPTMSQLFKFRYLYHLLQLRCFPVALQAALRFLPVLLDIATCWSLKVVTYKTHFIKAAHKGNDSMTCVAHNHVKDNRRIWVSSPFELFLMFPFLFLVLFGFLLYHHLLLLFYYIVPLFFVILFLFLNNLSFYSLILSWLMSI